MRKNRAAVQMTTGAGIGYALALLIVWGLAQAGMIVPDDVANALEILLTWAVGIAGIYLTPPPADDGGPRYVRSTGERVK